MLQGWDLRTGPVSPRPSAVASCPGVGIVLVKVARYSRVARTERYLLVLISQWEQGVLSTDNDGEKD